MTRLFADLALTETNVQSPIRLLVRAFQAWMAAVITAHSSLSALIPYFEKLPEWVVYPFFPSLTGLLSAFYARLRVYHGTAHLNGNDLILLGVPQGPELGKIRTALEAAWLDNHIQTREDEESFVRAFITE